MKTVRIRFIKSSLNSWTQTVAIGTEIEVCRYVNTPEEDGPFLYKVWKDNYQGHAPFPSGFPPVIYAYNGISIRSEYIEKNKTLKPHERYRDAGWIRAEEIEEISSAIEPFALKRTKQVSTQLSLPS